MKNRRKYIMFLMLTGILSLLTGCESNSNLGKEISAAVGNTAMGVAIVFFILIFLSFFISLFRFIPIIQEKLQRKQKETQGEKEGVIEKTSVFEEENMVDDLELVAVITAAIAAAEGTRPDQYIVRSIRKVRRRK
ncbi:OadG family transporter subunit [Anaerostipes sp.]|uniref:OadG family transporter subunit n=1 Tax=Anaerostipes sp. TaxID=1872530 RepID=UPI003FEF7801